MNTLKLRSFVPEIAVNFLDQFLYFSGLKTSRVEIHPAQHLDPEALPFFLEKLSGSKLFLEFGSGGSTIAAARMGKRFVTVESDENFLSEVKKAIGPGAGRSQFFYTNVGRTGPWGIPIIKFKTRARLARWRRYVDAPWAYLKESGEFPDLIFIDGRFRVACALSSFKYLQGRSDALVLVDDYVGRPEYQVIEKFGTLEKTVGRLAVFRSKATAPQALEAAIDQYIGEWL